MAYFKEEMGEERKKKKKKVVLPHIFYVDMKV
jgi:hypothetical protein